MAALSEVKGLGEGFEPKPGLKPQDVTQLRVTEIFKGKFEALIIDHEIRKEAANKDYTIIHKRGFWFGNDVYQFLQDQEPVNKSGSKPTLELFRQMGSFYHGKAPTGFTIQPDMKSVTGKHIQRYVLNPKAGLTPEQGLLNAKESFSFTDCGSLIQIAYYETILDIWGSERFNQYFKADGEHPLTIDPHPQLTPLLSFLEAREIKLTGTFGKRDLSEGDWVHIRNVPAYGVVHKMGEWQGENAVYWGMLKKEQIFKGFGFSSKGVTEAQINSRLVSAINEKPLEVEALVAKEVAQTILDSYEPGFANEAKRAGVAVEDIKAIYADLQMTEESFYQIMEMEQAGFNSEVKRLSAPKIRAQMEDPKKAKAKKTKGKRK